MEIIKWAGLSLLTIFTGMVVGFGFSTRKVVVVWYHIAGIVLLAFMVFLSFFFIGNVLGDFLSVRIVEVLVGLGLIVTGILIAASRPVYPGNRDLVLFVLALQLDVLLLSYHYAQDHDKSFGLALTVSLLLTGSIVGGMVFGERKWSNWRVMQMIPYVSCLLLILIGLIKVL